MNFIHKTCLRPLWWTGTCCRDSTRVSGMTPEAEGKQFAARPKITNLLTICNKTVLSPRPTFLTQVRYFDNIKLQDFMNPKDEFKEEKPKLIDKVKERGIKAKCSEDLLIPEFRDNILAEPMIVDKIGTQNELKNKPHSNEIQVMYGAKSTCVFFASYMNAVADILTTATGFIKQKGKSLMVRNKLLVNNGLDRPAMMFKSR